MKHRKTVKRVLEYIRPYGFKIIEMLILAVITVAFTLYTPILIGRGVDYIVGPGEVWSEKLFENSFAAWCCYSGDCCFPVAYESAYKSGYISCCAGYKKPCVFSFAGSSGILYGCQSARRYFKSDRSGRKPVF